MSAPLDAPARRRPLSDIPQPYVARELLSTAQACLSLSSLLPESLGLETSAAFETVVTALYTREVGTCSDVVCDALSSLGYEYTQALLVEAEDSLARQSGLPAGTSLRTENAQIEALARAGIRVAGCSREQLAPVRRRLVVRALEGVQALLHTLEWIDTGGLRAALATGYAETGAQITSTDVALATSSLVERGIDGEKLLAAVIRFESCRHNGLIWLECNRAARALPGRVSADMLSYGWRGLCAALKNYDPERTRFATYAITRIRGAIHDGVRAENPVPKRLTTYSRKADKATQDLTQVLRRVPTLVEVAAHMEEDLDKLNILPRLQHAASLEEMSNPYADQTREPSCLIDHADPAERALDALRRQAIGEALDALPADEACAVRLLVLEGYSTTEAKHLTGANPRQLRQRAARGITKLRSTLAEWDELNV